MQRKDTLATETNLGDNGDHGPFASDVEAYLQEEGAGIEDESTFSTLASHYLVYPKALTVY